MGGCKFKGSRDKRQQPTYEEKEINERYICLNKTQTQEYIHTYM